MASLYLLVASYCKIIKKEMRWKLLKLVILILGVEVWSFRTLTRLFRSETFWSIYLISF